MPRLEHELQPRPRAPRHRGFIVAFAALAVATWLAPAAAQTDEENKQKARELYEEGTRQYEAGGFDLAIEAWKHAYELYPRPDFLYNIGQAYRRKADAPQALEYYERYLAEKPNAANRVETEATIRELKAIVERDRARADGDRAAQTPAVAPAPSAPDVDPNAGKSLRLAGLITAGAGVALVATGIVFSLQAQGIADDLEAAAQRHDPWTDSLADDERAGKRDEAIGITGIAVGAAAVVAGGILYGVGWQKSRVSTSASVSPGAFHAAVELRF